MDHLQAGSVSGLLPRVPSFPSFSAPALGLRPPPCAAAINTRRPLILVGTVAAEVAGKRAAQDAAIALRGPAGDRGTGGRGRQGWGARPPRVARLAAPCRFVPRVGGICGGHEWARRSDERLSPLGDMLAGVACHRAPPAVTLLSGENDRQSSDEPAALPGGVSAEKGGEMEAGLPVGLKTHSFLGFSN